MSDAQQVLYSLATFIQPTLPHKACQASEKGCFLGQSGSEQRTGVAPFWGGVLFHIPPQKFLGFLDMSMERKPEDDVSAHPVVSCKNCGHWSITNVEMRIGRCLVRGMLTEWCCGVRARTPSKIVFCPSFKKR